MEGSSTASTTVIAAGNLRALSAVLLGLIMSVGFVGNALLSATILSSTNLRRSLLHLCLLHLAGLNLLEVSLNMFLSLLFVAKGSWPGSGGAAVACSLNAALGIFVGLELLLGILLLVVDRTLTLISHSLYPARLTPLRFGVALATLWLVGMSLTLPVALGSLSTRMFPGRYFCGLAEGGPVGFAATLAAVHGAALLCLLLALGLIFYRAAQLRHDHRLLASSRLDDFTDKNVAIARFRELEALLDPAKLAVTLFIVYLVLHGPYLVLSLLDGIRNSAEVAAASGGALELAEEGETAIAWLKFVWPLLFPFLVFGYSKPVWKKMKALVCCHRSNMIVASVGVGGSGPSAGAAQLSPEELEAAPALVTGPEGLYLRRSFVDQSGKIHDDYSLHDVPAASSARLDGTSDYESDDDNDDGLQRTELVVLQPPSPPHMAPPKQDMELMSLSDEAAQKLPKARKRANSNGEIKVVASDEKVETRARLRTPLAPIPSAPSPVLGPGPQHIVQATVHRTRSSRM